MLGWVAMACLVVMALQLLAGIAGFSHLSAAEKPLFIASWARLFYLGCLVRVYLRGRFVSLLLEK